MRWSKVCIESLGYELAPNVVTSRALEERLAPLYRDLGLVAGQLEALTGIRERRFWDPRPRMAENALRAARKALDAASIDAGDVGAVLYGGVCRDNLEPSTACEVAAGLGCRGDVIVQDVSNACLGVVSGMVDVANRIELGQIRAGVVASCESAREITDVIVEKLLSSRRMDVFRASLATLTGGSGAVAVVLADADVSRAHHRLSGGVVRAAPEHFRLCRWGPDTGMPPSGPMTMETDAPAVQKNGVVLGRETWERFLDTLGWTRDRVDRTIMHQVTALHRGAILDVLSVPADRDFSTVEFLGNTGTVALPITLAIAAERGFVRAGDRVALLGIGSGLNCAMLGAEW